MLSIYFDWEKNDLKFGLIFVLIFFFYKMLFYFDENLFWFSLVD